MSPICVAFQDLKAYIQKDLSLLHTRPCDAAWIHAIMVTISPPAFGQCDLQCVWQAQRHSEYLGTSQAYIRHVVSDYKLIIPLFRLIIYVQHGHATNIRLMMMMKMLQNPEYVSTHRSTTHD